MKQPQELLPADPMDRSESDLGPRPRRTLPGLDAPTAESATQAFRNCFQKLPAAGLDHMRFLTFYELGAYEVALDAVTAEQMAQDHTGRLALYLASAALGAYDLPAAESFLRSHEIQPQLAAVTHYLRGLIAQLKGKQIQADEEFLVFDQLRSELPPEFETWHSTLFQQSVQTA